MREKGKGTREREEEYLSWSGTKDCLWIERRQMWPIGKWQFIKGKENRPPHVRTRRLVFIEHAD